ncbi:MAG: AAA-like domain-containing protein [Cyanobacteria bacterium P01_A01_bin.135]
MVDNAIDPQLTADINAALELLDGLLAPRQLTPVQELVFRQTWLGQTYQDMAEGSSYTTDYIRITGSQLWQSLSQVLGRKVTKSNLRISFKHYNNRSQRLSDVSLRSFKEPSPPPTAGHFDPGWQPPLRAVDLELPVGQVPLGSPLYADRPGVESRCYAAIHQPGALLRIKGVKLSGKTSLMARLLHYAQQSDFAVVALSMRQIGLESLENIDTFLSCFCSTVTRQLGLPNRFSQYKDDICSPLANSTDYFEQYLLPEVQSPLVIALDDVDILFDYPMVAANVLGLLRAWYERSRYGLASSALWQQLRLIIVHSTDAVLPLNIHQSPFNVGLSIKLPDFELSQLQYLTQRHGLEWLQNNGNDNLLALLDYLGGNPYRLRLALYHLAHGDISLNGVLKAGQAGEAGIFYDYLNQQGLRLQRHPPLQEAYREVLQSADPVALSHRTTSDLYDAGFVKLTPRGAEPSCPLYRDFFSRRLKPHRKEARQASAERYNGTTPRQGHSAARGELPAATLIKDAADLLVADHKSDSSGSAGV